MAKPSRRFQAGFATANASKSFDLLNLMCADGKKWQLNDDLSHGSDQEGQKRTTGNRERVEFQSSGRTGDKGLVTLCIDILMIQKRHQS